jgi:hypothetical protein
VLLLLLLLLLLLTLRSLRHSLCCISASSCILRLSCNCSRLVYCPTCRLADYTCC